MKPWKVVTKEMDGDQKISLILEGENDRSAKIEWDGCVELYDSVHLHICDLDNFISRLQSLRQEAVAYFGEDWGA